MRINNINNKTSMFGILFVSIFLLIFWGGFALCYVNNSVMPLSFTGFFQWYFYLFLASLEDSEPGFMWLLFVILPVSSIILLSIFILIRNSSLLKQKSSLNIKYIDLLPDRINFKFNKPQYNFICGYDEIKAMELVIKTVLVHSNTYGVLRSYPATNEVELNFTIIDNKKFSLNNTPVNMIKFIYSIIDYSKKIKKFSYRFSGAGEATPIKEKIENYLYRKK